MAKGDFTPVRLAEIQTTLDSLWKEPQHQKAYTPHGETVKAIKENQTATFRELENPDKEREVAVKWADWCDDTATTDTNADTCTTDQCDRPDPKTKTYALNTFIKDCFEITDEDYQKSVISRDETIALGLLSKQKNIYELFNTKIIAVLEANKGINPLLTNPATGTTYVYDAQKNTDVPANEMTITQFYPYLMQVLTLLRSNNTIMLDGANFFQARTIAAVENLNDNGKVDAALLSMYPYYNDLLGMVKAGVQQNTYMIDKGAVALANRVKFPVKPVEYNGAGFGFTRYSIPFPLIPGYNLDVQYEQACTDGNITHRWKLKLRAGIFVNPVRCDVGNTGIWGFKKVPAAA